MNLFEMESGSRRTLNLGIINVIYKSAICFCFRTGEIRTVVSIIEISIIIDNNNRCKY